MTMYLPLPPDGSLPEGAAPDSPRFDRVPVKEVPVKARLTLAAVGAVATALAVVMVQAGNWFGILAGIGGLGSLLAGVWGGRRSDDYRPSEKGAFVLATREHEEQVVYARLSRPSVSTANRVGAGIGGGVLGVAAAVVLALDLIDPQSGLDQWLFILLAAGLAAALLYVAVKGIPIPPWRDAETEPLPPRFHEFADPTRPLPPEAFARPEPLASPEPAPAAEPAPRAPS